MNDSNKTVTKTVTKSTPIFTILGIVFIVLKLAEIGQVATWSWWWVLGPFWMPVTLALSIAAVIIIAALIFGVIKYLIER